MLKHATKISIETSDDMGEAAVLLKQLASYAAKVKEKKEGITKPMNAALKAARALFAPLEDPLDEAISAVRKEMGRYQLAAEKAAHAEEERIAARVGEGKGHLKPETAVRQMEAIEKPASSIQTDDGQVKFRDQKKFEVMDITMLPLEYVVADESLIRKAMQDGTELPGVRYWIEKIPVNAR